MGRLVAGGWTQEQSDALKAHVEAGDSYSVAAAKINAKFGTSYSRNATIGRANRIGLASPVKEKKPRQARKYKPRIRIVSSNGNSNQKRIIQVPDGESYQTIDDEALDLAARHISFAELTSETCKWPYGDGPFTFCGCEKPAEGPYCHGHQLRSQRYKYHQDISEDERARRSEWFYASRLIHNRKKRSGVAA
jgi:GcrA cell cycle regulator